MVFHEKKNRHSAQTGFAQEKSGEIAKGGSGVSKTTVDGVRVH